MEKEFAFTVDHRIEDPASFRVAFFILLDGDLVMSPEHIGVALMVSTLRRAGFTARIWEMYPAVEASVLAELGDYAPQLSCFTLMSLNVLSCSRFCRQLRATLPRTTIVCGGPASTYSGTAILDLIPEVDVAAVGEGEPIIMDLAQKLSLGESIVDCPGICYRGHDGAQSSNAPRALLTDLGALPFAARDQFEAHGNKLEYLRISTSRGCVARCGFCSAPNLSNKVQSGRAWRGRSAESVLDEIGFLIRNYKFRTLDFIDSTFEDPDGGPVGKTRAAAIAQGIIDRGYEVYYNVCMRAENWSDADDGLMELLFRSGLEKVNVGIESGTEAELKFWNKLATVQDNVRMIGLLKKHGIYLAMGFIQFHPYSTVESLRNNAEFLKNNAGHNLRRLTERLEIYPGTMIVDRLERDGLLGRDFRISLNPYGYQFKDPAVEICAKYFASLYNNSDYHDRGIITEQSSVFRFETFNVVLETFISRIRRKHGAASLVDELLGALTRELYKARSELAAFNHAFFLDSLDMVLSGSGMSNNRQVHEIESRFASAIQRLKTKQMQIGMTLMRSGYDITPIRSALDERKPGGVTRTYTGGSPCW